MKEITKDKSERYSKHMHAKPTHACNNLPDLAFKWIDFAALALVHACDIICKLI
jgi:hypothetical protein